MLRIGEASKIYGISNRTLRYWEAAGVLTSTRAGNGYRYYDEANAARIKHIVLLRKLKMPIADIERIFIANDYRVAADTLVKYLANLKHDTAVYHALITIVENLIAHIKTSQNLEQMFLYIEAQSPSMDATQVDLKITSAPQIQLSERIIMMEQLSNVRIVRLPAMTVASYCAVSATPEKDCAKVFDKLVLENNLHKRSGFRSFGFDNPGPSEGSPVYGYETWVTIPEDFEVPTPFEKKEFAGGLYASISARLNEIGERWEALYHWSMQNDKYQGDFNALWLEELTMDYETFISDDVPDNEKQLDLLAPVKEK
jgi:DNA-binding transcriptional MerR regulator/predicted transcriptional regulator YdeE